MSNRSTAYKPLTTPPPPAPESAEDKQMSLMEHLIELRSRLIWIVGSLLVATLLSMAFVVPILEFITRPLSELGRTPQALGPTDSIGVFFKVSFTMGTGFALPMIIYQIIAFMAPGLYPHERRAILWTLPAILILFLIGAAFAYFMLLPAAVGFLQEFLGTVIVQDWSIDRYIGFVTRLVFWIGVSFELPLVVAILARMGLITGPKLLSVWRYAIIVIALAAAAITPTVDPVNMTLVMGPLAILYGVSVGLAYMLYRDRDEYDPDAPLFPMDDEEEVAEAKARADAMAPAKASQPDKATEPEQAVNADKAIEADNGTDPEEDAS
jgi:sec-independent protein translocase protein TatC